MSRWIRRAIALSLITAIALTLVRRGRPTEVAVAPPSAWPPFEPRAGSVEPAPAPPIDPEPAWVLPVDGGCPDGYPIKANVGSHIFHVPGGRFYDRGQPERCYATAEAAERDGYRRAKA